MTKFAITVLITVFGFSASAEEMFSACEHVSDMAVLAKDNVPYWTANRNSQVKSCYADIKEFITVATLEDIAQFNAEYDGQIAIYTTDADFAGHVTDKKAEGQNFVFPSATQNSLTPVIKMPFAKPVPVR